VCVCACMCVSVHVCVCVCVCVCVQPFTKCTFFWEVWHIKTDCLFWYFITKNEFLKKNQSDAEVFLDSVTKPWRPKTPASRYHQSQQTTITSNTAQQYYRSDTEQHAWLIMFCVYIYICFTVHCQKSDIMFWIKQICGVLFKR